MQSLAQLDVDPVKSTEVPTASPETRMPVEEEPFELVYSGQQSHLGGGRVLAYAHNFEVTIRTKRADADSYTPVPSDGGCRSSELCLAG